MKQTLFFTKSVSSSLSFDQKWTEFMLLYEVDLTIGDDMNAVE